jgi:hypothetical protein
VLRLLEVFPLAEVAAAIQDAIDRGALGFDAIKLLTLCRIEQRPAQLDLSGYPYLTRAVVKTTAASDYLALVPGRAASPPTAPRSSSQDPQTADIPARVRQGGAAMRGRRPPSLPAPAGRVGVDGAGAANDRAPDPRGQVPGGQIARHVRLRGHSVPQQDAGARTQPLRIHRASGKRHCAWQLGHRQIPHRSLGLAACQRGFTVGFITAAGLVHQLLEARDERRLLKLQQQLQSCKLLIVDELGYVPLSSTGGELLFETFSQRYERGSTIVTSNLPFDEWTGVFGNERLTGALLDRLTHHLHILEMNGESYRLKHSIARRQPKASPPILRLHNPSILTRARSARHVTSHSHGEGGQPAPFSMATIGSLLLRHTGSLLLRR